MQVLRTSVAGKSLSKVDAPAGVHGTPLAHPAADLCWYDDQRPIAVYIEVPSGRIGWCTGHLSRVGDWPARCAEEMA